MKESGEEEDGMELTVKRSPISGSGIARVHAEVLKDEEFQEGKPVLVVSKGGKKRVMRLVADSMMEKGKISLRQKDLEKLSVRSEDSVRLLPYRSVGSRLTGKLFRSGK